MIDFHYRIECAKEYLLKLEISLESDWTKLYSRAMKENDLIMKLALIHPEHFVNAGIDEKQYKEIVQGKRSFGPNFRTSNCESELIWGYSCNLNDDIEQDHLFPYSLGGKTIPANRVFLCKYHNQVKSSDIHNFPWENLRERVEPWLDEQLGKASFFLGENKVY